MRESIAVVMISGLFVAACSSDAVDSNEQARRAYLGLDKSIGKELALGFKGFSDASNANIPTESGTGDKSGTVAISGHVDAGSSTNKTMHVNVAMVMYSDGPVAYDDQNHTVTITYDTDTTVANQPLLSLTFNGFTSTPGAYVGDLNGTYHLSGDLKGDVDLALHFSGMTSYDSGTMQVSRTPGSTTVTGTATDGDGMFTVDVTL